MVECNTATQAFHDNVIIAKPFGTDAEGVLKLGPCAGYWRQVALIN